MPLPGNEFPSGLIKMPRRKPPVFSRLNTGLLKPIKVFS